MTNKRLGKTTEAVQAGARSGRMMNVVESILIHRIVVAPPPRPRSRRSRRQGDFVVSERKKTQSI